jgi:nucleoid-associated protein YgaU
VSRLRGFVALVTTLAFVVGVPWLLVKYGNWPITDAPSVDELRELADTVVSDTMVFGVLTVGAWIVWAGFTLSILVESAAAVRGVQAPRLAFAGPLQRSARALVAAIVLAISLSHHQPAAFAASPRASAAVPLPRAAAEVAHVAEAVPRTHGVHSVDSGGEAPEDVGVDTAQTLVVRRGDSAWGLAEQHLGDGMRWRELWELNRDRPQPDGRAWTDPQIIVPGWHLVLPSDVTSRSSPSAAAASIVHVVVAGDTLTGIAEAHLGDGHRYVEIFDLNRDLPQPDGRRLTDPDLIIPGWHLRLPSPEPVIETTGPTSPSETAPPPDDASTMESEPALPPPQPGVGVSDPVPPTSTTPTTVGQPEAPAVVEPTDSNVAPAERGGVRTTAVPPNERETPTDAGAHDGDSFWAATAPVLAGVSGATVLATGLLMRLRRSKRRRLIRGVGDAPVEGGRAARAVVAAADVPLVRWAGRALAEMVSRIRARDASGSAPLAVELSPERGIELLWDTPTPNAVAPWVAADEGWAWRLPYDPDGEIPADEMPAAIPALVTIGRREGRQLMVDLEAFGTVAVAGDPERIDDFLRALALELSNGDDLADSYILTVGVDGVAESDRLAAADLDTAAERATSICHSVRDVLESARAPTSFAYRCGAGGAHLETTVVIVAATVEDDPTCLSVEPRSGVAVVAAAVLPDARATIEIDSDGTARLYPLGVSFVAAGVPRETVAVIDENRPNAGDGEPVDATSNGHRPGPPRTEQVAMRSMNGYAPALFELPADKEAESEEYELPAVSPLDASLVVKVLGTPRVPDRPELKRRELILTVYLACRGGRVNASAVQDALWNGQAVQGKTVWNLVGRTRTALGQLPDGTWVLMPSDRNRHVKGLAPGVTTDLAIFRYLYEQAQTASSSEAIGLLRQALGFVEGPPFDAEGYDWAHHGTQDVAEASRLIEQATEQLVDLALDIDDIDIAREAITQGLRGLPGDEVLYRLRMKVEHHAGNLTGVSAAYDELLRHLADFDAEPSPSTLELRRELLGAGHSSGSSPGVPTAMRTERR